MKAIHSSGAALTLCALLAACGGGGTDSTPTPTSYAVNGTLSTLNTSGTEPFAAWTGGAGTIRAATITDPSVQATGTVASGGAFSLSLPANIAGGSLEPLGEANIDLSDQGCTGSLSISNPNALGTGISFVVDGASLDGAAVPVDYQAVYVGPKLTSATVTFGLLLYVDAATTITGQQTCVVNGLTVTATVNAPLKAGYNRLNAALTVSESTSALNVTTGAWPSRWVVGASVGSLGLGKANKALLEGQVNSLLPLGLRF